MINSVCFSIQLIYHIFRRLSAFFVDFQPLIRIITISVKAEGTYDKTDEVAERFTRENLDVVGRLPKGR